jgi:hypothetical protein
VEGAHQFPVNVVERYGGFIRWSVRGKEVGSAGYTPEYQDVTLCGVTMRYTVTLHGQAPEPMEYFLPIMQRITAAGIRQKLWVCPLVVNGRHCGRTVRALYRPGGARYFGCRHCYRLVYASAQGHNKSFDYLAALQRGDLRAALRYEGDYERRTAKMLARLQR